jgi:hypothetical protein
MADPDLINRAKERSQSTPRSLRRVGDTWRRDMVVFEDRATGERRSVSNKMIRNLGDAVAFELSDSSALLEDSRG